MILLFISLKTTMNNTPFFRRPFKYVNYHATVYLILINAIVYFLCSFFPNLLYYLSLNVVYIIRNKMLWQFVTYMFVHANIRHLLLNMLGLFFFGMGVERAIGSKEFRLFYFTCGILSGVLSFVYYYFNNVFSISLIGASGFGTSGTMCDSLVPNPPAKITACFINYSCSNNIIS